MTPTADVNTTTPLRPTSSRLATVRIASDETRQGYLIINKDDFDPDVHQVHASDPGDAGEPIGPIATHRRGGERVPSDEDGGSEFPHEKRVPTMRVQSDETASGHMIINRDDFDPAIHTPVDNATRAVSDVDVGDLSSMSFPALKAVAKQLGVKASGTRAKVEAAILEHVTNPANVVGDEASTEGTESAESAESAESTEGTDEEETGPTDPSDPAAPPAAAPAAPPAAPPADGQE